MTNLIHGIFLWSIIVLEKEIYDNVTYKTYITFKTDISNETCTAYIIYTYNIKHMHITHEEYNNIIYKTVIYIVV